MPAGRGIAVTNTPDVLKDDGADLGIGLVIAALREMPRGHDYVRSGDWARQGMMGFTTSLTGKTLGIVGLGRIGHELANRAKALKLRIAYTGRRRQAVDYDYYASVDELAAASDVPVLTCPGGGGDARADRRGATVGPGCQGLAGQSVARHGRR